MHLSLPSTPGMVAVSWTLGSHLATATQLVEWSGEEAEGSCTSTATLPRHLVDLWWPNGAGEQALYDLEVTVTPRDSRTLLDSASRRVAFRAVELVQQPITDHIDVKKVNSGGTSITKSPGPHLLLCCKR